MVALGKLSLDSDSLLNSFLNSKRNFEIRITVCSHVSVDASCDVSVTLEYIVEFKWCLTERTPWVLLAAQNHQNFNWFLNYLNFIEEAVPYIRGVPNEELINLGEFIAILCDINEQLIREAFTFRGKNWALRACEVWRNYDLP